MTSPPSQSAMAFAARRHWPVGWHMTKPYLLDLSLSLFPLGRLLITPHALEMLNAEGCSVSDLLKRHVTGDWREMHAEDARANREALSDGSRVFSSFRVGTTGQTIWIITEADRSATTLLLPSEY